MSLAPSRTMSVSVSEKEPKIYSQPTKKGGPTKQGTINFHEEKPKNTHRPFGWRKLFKRPVVRQYIHNGHIWREREEREPSRFELFFDLIFVGIIHQVAEGATEEFSGRNIALFILLFFPSWTIWQDTRAFLNISGTDDIIQRLYILSKMALLVGYSANASAIKLPGSSSSESSPQVEITDSESSRSVLFPNLRPAILFFLVARFLQLAYYVVYGFFLPKFRGPMWWNAITIGIHSAFYVPLVWVQKESTIWILASIGLVIELNNRYLHRYLLRVPLLLHLGSRKRVMNGDHYTTALNIEHHIERTSQFIIIVLGEGVANLTYKALASEIGVSKEFGRSIFGLMAAYLVCWIYFDQETSHTYIHALRRHWFSGITANTLHFPFCCGLIIWSAAMKSLVFNEEVSQGVRWYFSGGLACALLSLASLSWMHKNLDAPGSSFLSMNKILTSRVVFSIVIAVLPLSRTLKNSAKNLAVHVSILAFLVMIDTAGKIGTMPAETTPTEVIVPEGFDGETEDQARRADLIDEAKNDLNQAELITEAGGRFAYKASVKR